MINMPIWLFVVILISVAFVVAVISASVSFVLYSILKVGAMSDKKEKICQEKYT